MRWIATLVATCLVALCALRPVARVQPPHGRGHGALGDASDVVAKVAARHAIAPAPDKRDERLADVVLAAPPGPVLPPGFTLTATCAPTYARGFASQFVRFARGPPRISSLGIVSVSC